MNSKTISRLFHVLTHNVGMEITQAEIDLCINLNALPLDSVWKLNFACISEYFYVYPNLNKWPVCMKTMTKRKKTFIPKRSKHPYKYRLTTSWENSSNFYLTIENSFSTKNCFFLALICQWGVVLINVLFELSFRAAKQFDLIGLDYWEYRQMIGGFKSSSDANMATVRFRRQCVITLTEID